MKRVIVFGSNILDMFFEMQDFGFFTATGPGSEDAKHFKTHQQAPGGKGANQAVAAAMAGAKVEFYGAVGKGAHGRYILDNFRDHKISTKGIIQTEAPTGAAVILTKPDGKHKIIVSHGANLFAKQSQIPDSALGPKTILLLQAELDATENQKLMERGKKSGATVILNLAPARPISKKALANIDYLIVNEPEAEALATHLGIKATNAAEVPKLIANAFNLMCIVTLGERGSLAYAKDMVNPLHVPALAVKAKDTVGAGDAYAGAFAAALANDLPIETALRHAAVAGSLACTKMGAQSALPTKAQIDRAVPKLPGRKAALKSAVPS